MDKIEAIVSRLPHFYAAVNSDRSTMWNFLKAFADEFDILVQEYIDRADNDIGIMTTDARDLDWRWGSMLGFPRRAGEGDERYRIRLANMINALRGGTKAAVQYGVALLLGIEGDPVLMDQVIKVYDAWKYPGTLDDKSYGNFLVDVSYEDDLITDKYMASLHNEDIRDIIYVVKAAGTNCIIMFRFGKVKAITQAGAILGGYKENRPVYVPRPEIQRPGGKTVLNILSGNKNIIERKWMQVSTPTIPRQGGKADFQVGSSDVLSIERIGVNIQVKPIRKPGGQAAVTTGTKILTTYERFSREVKNYGTLD